MDGWDNAAVAAGRFLGILLLVLLVRTIYRAVKKPKV